MKTALIGYTGFVGSNIAKNMKFDDYYDSSNIDKIKDKEYDLLISSGIRAEKYLANNYPERDLNEIKKLLENLSSIKNLKKIVLISTVDVYKNPVNVNEDTGIDENNLHPYGKNRYFAEKYVKENFKDYLIVRLPGLFGINLKKNFIYDMTTKIPTMIIKSKYEELLTQAKNEEKDILNLAYEKNSDGNYVFNGKKSKKLIEILENINFTSLNFTDSRSVFQFYNLNNLANDIEKALENNIKILNITSEPVTAKEIAKICFDYNFNNEILDKPIANYDIQSKYFEIFGGKNGYLYNKEEIFEDIKKLVKNMENE